MSPFGYGIPIGISLTSFLLDRSRAFGHSDCDGLLSIRHLLTRRRLQGSSLEFMHNLLHLALLDAHQLGKHYFLPDLTIKEPSPT